jgi:hypothetical protein
MKAPRHRVLLLASPRAAWAGHVSMWASSGAIAIDCVQCVSATELITRLDSGRRWSAALLDGELASVDRDLIARLGDARCAAIVVGSRRGFDDWAAIGADRLLSNPIDRNELIDALAEFGDPVPDASVPFLDDAGADPSPRSGLVLAVTGSGGTGASSIAGALAQGAGVNGTAILLDACLHAEQAMLHDATDVSRGIQELVESHRTGAPAAERVDPFLQAVPQRGYDLIVGLRRSRYWSAIRPASFGSALESLAERASTVVIDVDADFEQETDGGSVDIEERTAMARISVLRADLVFAIGHPSMKGLHALHRVLVDLANLGVPVERTVPVFNQAVRTPRVRSEYVRALSDLAPWRGDTAVPPLFVPARDIDRAHRDGSEFPSAVVEPLLQIVSALTNAPGHRHRGIATSRRPWSRVKPGELARSGVALGSGGADDEEKS